jgi:hypothetical protein
MRATTLDTLIDIVLCLQNFGLISENKTIEAFANIEFKSCFPNVILQIKLNFHIGN